MSDIENQLEEISSLKYICNEEEFITSEDNATNGYFNIFVTLPENFELIYKNLDSGEGAVVEYVNVSHLPPIVLTFDLPPNYPSEAPPKYTLSCTWLNLGPLKKLCKKLDSIWNEQIGMGVLFSWFNFLKLESLEYLSITNKLDISTQYTIGQRQQQTPRKNSVDDNSKVKSQTNPSVISNSDKVGNTSGQSKTDYQSNKSKKPHHHKLLNRSKPYNKKRQCKKSRFDDKITRSKLPVPYVRYLLMFDQERCKIEFNRQMYSCCICFEDKLGLICTQFQPCEHVFCIDCVLSFYKVRIKDCSIQVMPCPMEKCKSEASQNQLREILGPELYARYDSLLLNATLDTMQDIVFCPRKACQGRVLIEQSESMGTCPICNYAFCVLCNMTYHGVEPCKLQLESKRAIVIEYESADAEGRKLLEAKYGKKQLANVLETFKSESYIIEKCKPCPKCAASIEKSDGCNKMHCSKCDTSFCWLCGSRLDPTTPYKHFHDPKSKCYTLLYEGVYNEDNLEYFEFDDWDEDEDEALDDYFDDEEIDVSLEGLDDDSDDSFELR